MLVGFFLTLLVSCSRHILTGLFFFFFLSSQEAFWLVKASVLLTKVKCAPFLE